jgi:branched-chain amino acid aminotransferase
MGLDIAWSDSEILTGILDLLNLEPKATQYIRPIAFRGAPELWVTGSEGRPVDVSIFTVRTEAHRDLDHLISCQISPIERISSRSIQGQIKVSGAYVNSFFARRTAEKSGFHDGLMFDREGCLAEASAANVFLIAGEHLTTPRLNPDVFPGITRDVLLGLARSIGIEVVQSDLRRQDLAQIKGAFLCSTLMEIRGVSLLDDRPLGTVELPVFKSLVNSFRKMTHQ